MYDIEITVDGAKVTFSDADGACDELVLQDAIGSSERLYVYVGTYYYSAAWHSVEICRWLLAPTAAPTTAMPSASPTITAVRMGSIFLHEPLGSTPVLSSLMTSK